MREQREALQHLARALEVDNSLADAIGAQSQVVALARTTATRRQLGYDLLDLARLKVKVGDVADAATSLEEAVGIFRATQIVDGEASALLSLGEVYEITGQNDDAGAAYSRAIELLGRSIQVARPCCRAP